MSGEFEWQPDDAAAGVQTREFLASNARRVYADSAYGVTPVGTFVNDGDTVAIDYAGLPFSTGFADACRSLGVADIFDAFLGTIAGEPIAQYLLRNFPQDMLNLTIEFLDKNQAVFRDEITDLFRQNYHDDRINEESVSLVLTLITAGFRLDSETSGDFFVPIYCAHPVSDPFIPVKIAVESESSEQLGFEISIPGFSGGLSRTVVTSFSLVTDEPSRHSFQYQKRMASLVRSWQKGSKTVRTFSTQETPGIKFATKDGADYIVYANEADKKQREARQPVDFVADVKATYEQKISVSDTDEFKLPLVPAGIDSFITVGSTALSSFAIAYELVRPYRYRWYGLNRNSHDIHPVAEPLGRSG